MSNENNKDCRITIKNVLLHNIDMQARKNERKENKCKESGLTFYFFRDFCYQKPPHSD